MAKRKGTATKSFGTGKREGHDASAFYGRKMYAPTGIENKQAGNTGNTGEIIDSPNSEELSSVYWQDNLFYQSSEHMTQLPDESIALAFTSPPYNVGKEYDDDLPLDEYLRLIENVGSEVYRTLVTGGRYVLNVANLGRSPYVPLTSHFWRIHMALGFLPMGEVIWRKGKGASSSVAWGSWMRASAPRLRDVHEYLLVMAKGTMTRSAKGVSTIPRDEFMRDTLSIWDIPAESATRIGHPAPFPLALAERVINLWSFKGDTVLDPFIGSGTTAVAAQRMGRHYVGYEVSEDYIALAQRRLGLPHTAGFVDGAFGFERI